MKHTERSTIRLSQVSRARQDFVRHCQRVPFCTIRWLAVCNGEPVFQPQTEVLIELKLDGDADPRPEQRLQDFALSAEVVRLFAKFDQIRNGVIGHIEVRTGIPRRIVFQSPALTTDRP